MDVEIVAHLRTLGYDRGFRAGKVNTRGDAEMWSRDDFRRRHLTEAPPVKEGKLDRAISVHRYRQAIRRRLSDGGSAKIKGCCP